MINLDSMNVEELQEFVAKTEDKEQFALQIFPEKPPAFVKSLLLLKKYAQERIEVLERTRKGRLEQAAKSKKRCDDIFRVLPDYAKWA